MTREEVVQKILKLYLSLLTDVLHMNGSILDLHMSNLGLYLETCSDSQIDSSLRNWPYWPLLSYSSGMVANDD